MDWSILDINKEKLEGLHKKVTRCNEQKKEFQDEIASILESMLHSLIGKYLKIRTEQNDRSVNIRLLYITSIQEGTICTINSLCGNGIEIEYYIEPDDENWLDVSVTSVKDDMVPICVASYSDIIISMENMEIISKEEFNPYVEYYKNIRNGIVCREQKV